MRMRQKVREQANNKMAESSLTKSVSLASLALHLYLIIGIMIQQQVSVPRERGESDSEHQYFSKEMFNNICQQAQKFSIIAYEILLEDLRSPIDLSLFKEISTQGSESGGIGGALKSKLRESQLH